MAIRDPYKNSQLGVYKPAGVLRRSIAAAIAESPAKRGREEPEEDAK
jgi:hypothetical protein